MQRTMTDTRDDDVKVDVSVRENYAFLYIIDSTAHIALLSREQADRIAFALLGDHAAASPFIEEPSYMQDAPPITDEDLDETWGDDPRDSRVYADADDATAEETYAPYAMGVGFHDDAFVGNRTAFETEDWTRQVAEAMAAGDMLGYERGYTAGYDDGYQQGYDDGDADRRAANR